MKLYYAPGACSLAPHIVLREVNAAFELEKVDLTTGITETGSEFATVNPLGYVPVLILDSGASMTEAGVIIQYIADQYPDVGLAPPMGSPERYRLMECINVISSELHKQFAPLFKPDVPTSTRAAQQAILQRRISFMDNRLSGQPFLMGNSFMVADAYLFTVLNWADKFDISLNAWPAVQAFRERVKSRPAVQTALRTEGLH